MYIARFELDAGLFHVGAADLGCRPAAPLVPRLWHNAILDADQCDFALRLCFRAGDARGRVFISARDPAPLQQVLERLAGCVHPADGTSVATNTEEFDRLSDGLPPRQVWLNQRGYNVNGRPVAADFQFYPLLERLVTIRSHEEGDLVYQINLRRYRPDPAQARAVRKYIAALRLEPPFPTPMTNLQAAIANRLLRCSFLSDEILAVGDALTLSVISDAIAGQFKATMGAFGFDAPPVEMGQFDDLLVSGLHSTCFGEQSDFICHGAGALPVEDLRRFLATPLPVPLAGSAANSGATAHGYLPVFVSYASKDFIQALATSRHLESYGIGCWIAPRNILPGEAYPDAIIRGINGCKAMVLLLSESSNLSPHVHREIERALHRNAVIIPLRLQDIQPTGSMEYLLSTCQWIDAFAPGLDTALGQLMQRLKTLLAAGVS